MCSNYFDIRIGKVKEKKRNGKKTLSHVFELVSPEEDGYSDTLGNEPEVLNTVNE